MSRIKAIAAVALNGVIGNGLKIPWHISEDFKHFKKTTSGAIVVMGRKTWDSLGRRPLPNRENVVITSNPAAVENARAFASLRECLDAYAADPRTVWICGGASLYKTALPLCEEIILSRVKMCPKGDIFFPDTRALFKKTTTLSKSGKFNVVRYVRKSANISAQKTV